MTDHLHKQRIGKWGEQVAYQFLMNQGLSLIAKNVRTPYGEIDLLMMEAGCLVFIEVKARTSSTFGMPEEAITTRKREHLIQSAESYLSLQLELPDSWRIDVIAIRGKPSLPNPEIEWFKNAVV